MLIKFSEEKYILDLYNNGTVFMNSIQYFREFEDNNLKGDVYEGVNSLTNYPKGEFEIEGLNFKGNYISLHVRESYEKVLGNLYCMYCISPENLTEPENFKIDIRNLDFGSHCLIIKNTQEFVKRIENALTNLSLTFRRRLVEYYEKEKINGEINVFQKRKEYDFQNEYRFYVERESTESLEIQIGNLKGIAEVLKAEDIVDGLRLKVNNP